VDGTITPEHQSWVYEVHPEVSFWRLNNRMPMRHSKSRLEGRRERLDLLREEFPLIDQHVNRRDSGVGADDVLDAAVAAWSALRIWRGVAGSVCEPVFDPKGLSVCIRY
jgi:predicted RNase H-like nuclease